MRHVNDDGAASPGRPALAGPELIPESTTPGGGQALQGEGQDRGQADFAVDDCALQVTAGKTAAELQAQAALTGIALHCLPDGAFVACRWGQTRRGRGVSAARGGCAMTRATTTATTITAHTPPLQIDACRCRGAGRCMTCRRFVRYIDAVQQRRQAWKQQA